MDWIVNNRLAHRVNWLFGKNPELTSVTVKSKWGPQFAASIRNMESILSQITEGRDIYEAGRQYQQELHQVTSGVGGPGSRKTVEGLSDKEKAALVQILDTVEDLDALGDHKVVAAAKEVRSQLDEIHGKLSAQIPEMGYVRSYFPHVFQGKFWVDVAGGSPQGQELHKVETLKEALTMAQEIAEKTGKRVSVIQDTFIPSDEATMLTRRAFRKLVGTLKKGVGNSFRFLRIFPEPRSPRCCGRKGWRPGRTRILSAGVPQLKLGAEYFSLLPLQTWAL